VIKAEHDLPGTEGGKGERVGEGQGGEMIQIMYADKKNNNKKILKKNSQALWCARIYTNLIHNL
jgi:hypothetical protein